MDWTEIVVKTKQEYADDVASIMQMVSNGIYIEDYSNLEQNIMEISHVDLIDSELLARDRENVKVHVYISPTDNPIEHIDFIKERLNENNIDFEIDITKIDDQDWENNWKKYYKPFNVGEKLLIKPEWEEIDNSHNRTVLNIAPGLAFGTGTHESTKLCLEFLEKNISIDDTVLDVGCGSGILSIAALLLGAKKAVAIDIDSLAVKIAKQNGALNNFDHERLTVLEGNLVDRLTKDEGVYDVVVANIIADVIIMLASQIKVYLKRGGLFICSGIIDEKQASVVSALEANGFIIKQIENEKGWAAISATIGT